MRIIDRIDLLVDLKVNSFADLFDLGRLLDLFIKNSRRG